MARSGFIPTVEGFELELVRARGLPVAIAHGTADPVISVEFGRDARTRLEAAGADVLYREAPVVHTIDPAIVPDLRDWLSRVLPPRGETNSAERASAGPRGPSTPRRRTAGCRPGSTARHGPAAAARLRAPSRSASRFRGAGT